MAARQDGRRDLPHFVKSHPVQLEISGPTAMWTRPDTGSSPVSYVAPTFSAAKGIFESVLRWKSVNVRPTKVEVCRPVQFHRYTTNYGGPLRASDAFAKGASFQFYAVVLIDVCYRLYAEADFAGHHESSTWPPHAYHDVFNRALQRGQWFYTPCLGWKEFVPDYVGPFRAHTRVCESENHELPTMLRMVFDQMQGGKVKPSFYNKNNHPNLRVEKGVLVYAQ
jgi:CRISPR-associated protein Cas5d